MQLRARPEEATWKDSADTHKSPRASPAGDLATRPSATLLALFLAQEQASEVAFGSPGVPIRPLRCGSRRFGRPLGLLLVLILILWLDFDLLGLSQYRVLAAATNGLGIGHEHSGHLG